MEVIGDTQVKIQAGIAKKVGRPNYSSYDAALSVTIVTNVSAIADDRFGDLVSNIYDKVQQAVDARIAWECRNDGKPPVNAQVAPSVMANTQPAPTPVPEPVSPVAPAVEGNHPAVVFSDFRDFLAAESTQLGVQPDVIVNSLYRQLIGGPLVDWREKGAVLVQHWSMLGNEVASKTYTDTVSDLIPF